MNLARLFNLKPKKKLLDMTGANALPRPFGGINTTGLQPVPLGGANEPIEQTFLPNAFRGAPELPALTDMPGKIGATLEATPAQPFADPTLNQVQPIAVDAQPAAYQPTQTVSGAMPQELGATTAEQAQAAFAPQSVGSYDGQPLAVRPRFAMGSQPEEVKAAIPPVTGSRAAMADIERVRNADKSEFREKSAGKRFVSGLGRAFGSWGQAGAPGGLAGLVGALLTGGLGATFAPGADSEVRKERQLQKALGTFSQQTEAEKMQNDLLKSQTDLQGKIIGNERSKLDYLLTQNKPFYDSIMADGMVTPEEAEEASKRGYDISPYDARRFESEVREGATYERPQLGKPTWQESDLPTERVKVPVGVKVKNADGTEMEVPMLPQPAADFRYKSEKEKADAIARQAEIERKEREIQEKREEKTFGSVQEWEAARTKARTIIPTYERSISQINQSIAEIDRQIQTYQGSYDTSDLVRTKQSLEKQRTDAELKLAEARAIEQTPKPRTFTPARSNRNPKRNRSYTDSDIDRIIRQ